MAYKVVDNYLSKPDFDVLAQVMTTWDFPWFYQSQLNNYHVDTLDCYLTHLFFENLKEDGSITGYSKHASILKPILKKLKPRSLIRIKGNLYLNTPKVMQHKHHTDYNYKHKGAIFYVNTNNGFTILENKIKIKSIANRMLFFDAHKPHASTSTSDQKIRVNINFNYF